jgi:hypothetical protein
VHLKVLRVKGITLAVHVRSELQPLFQGWADIVPFLLGHVILQQHDTLYPLHFHLFKIDKNDTRVPQRFLVVRVTIQVDATTHNIFNDL